MAIWDTKQKNWAIIYLCSQKNLNRRKEVSRIDTQMGSFEYGKKTTQKIGLLKAFEALLRESWTLKEWYTKLRTRVATAKPSCGAQHQPQGPQKQKTHFLALNWSTSQRHTFYESREARLFN